MAEEQKVVRRRERKAEEVAVRIAAFLQRSKDSASPHVRPLNRGFFTLERMRDESRAKKRVKQKQKARSK